MENLNLNLDDINEFRILVNYWENKLKNSSRVMVQNRSLCSTGKISKAEYKKSITDFNILKAEYKKNVNLEKFLKNYKYHKNLLNKTKKEDEHFNSIKNEFLLAKKIYTLAKLSLKNKGDDGLFNKKSDIALKVENLYFKYNPETPYVLNNVNFEVKHGEYVAIIGHNGSGKSTLSKILIGVLTPLKGSLCFYGNYANSGNMSLIRKFLGIVFQNPDNQFVGSTVRDDVAFGLENRRVKQSNMNEIIFNSLKKVNMEKFADFEPLMLSGGQKQRVAIASALALSTEILIFDEATSMLDPKGKTEVKKIILDLKETRKHTIFSITHDMDEILNADKILVMNKGEVLKFDTPDVILKDSKFLKSIHLDIPFVSQVEEALKENNIIINNTKSISELAERICQKIK